MPLVIINSTRAKFLGLATAVMIAYPTVTYAQQQQQFPAQGNVQSQSNAPKIEGVQGEELQRALAIVRAARGECRAIQNRVASPSTPEGKAQRTAAYRQCMAEKESGSFNINNYANILQNEPNTGRQGNTGTTTR